MYLVGLTVAPANPVMLSPDRGLPGTHASAGSVSNGWSGRSQVANFDRLYPKRKVFNSVGEKILVSSSVPDWSRVSVLPRAVSTELREFVEASDKEYLTNKRSFSDSF